MRTTTSIFVFFALLGCDPDYVALEPVPCEPAACQIISCEQLSSGIACQFSFSVEIGHWAEVSFQLSEAGELGWNELPYNADAGLFEDAKLVGEGQSCGIVTLDQEAAGHDLIMTCTDWTEGTFSVSNAMAL